ncbi:KilA-N domain-containing protein [Xenorhabdus eapokensis]
MTMSSREIADLVESRHDKVKQSIQRLAKRGVIQLPPMGEVNNNQSDSPNSRSKAYMFSGEKGKRDSIVVVAQLSPEFTARLVDRWQELENQLTKPQAPQPAVSNLVLEVDAAGRFNMTTVHRVSGFDSSTKRPHDWLRLLATKIRLKELSKTIDTGHKLVEVVRSGVLRGTFAHELLVIEYAGWFGSALQSQVKQAISDHYSRNRTVEINQTEYNIAVSFNRSLPKGIYRQNSKSNPYRAVVHNGSEKISVGCYPSVEEAVNAQNRYFETGEIKQVFQRAPKVPLPSILNADGQYLVTVNNGKVSKYEAVGEKTLVDAEAYWRLRKDINYTEQALAELKNRMRFVHDGNSVANIDYPIHEAISR